MPREVEAKKSCKSFACGIDAGRSFLPASSNKGKKMRWYFQKMHKMWGPWCWKYQSDDYVACLSRIWFESRGDPNSRTKDTKELEAGLTSVSWETAKLLEEELGIGGDPCGDPEYSIAASAYRSAHMRKHMFEGKKPDGDPTFWASFLPDLWDRNRIEAEYFMSACGSTNCQKIVKLLRIGEKNAGVLSSNHPWWNFMTWVKDLSNTQVLNYIAPLNHSPWKVGFRIGRSSFNGWKKRAEFFSPNPDGSPNYCWGNDKYSFPSNMPTPKTPITKQKDWRKGCILYSKRKARRKLWDPPEMPYGPKWEAWVDEQQAKGLLPSDAEYETWEHEMAQVGCAFQYQVSEEEWLKIQKKLNKPKKNKK